jgi:hypothetical protein
MGTEILPRKGDAERHFWRAMAEDVGACKGERTRYIYVLYGLSGAVHGYPVTEAWLRRIEGVNL